MQGQVGAARPSFKEVWHVVRMIFQQEKGRPGIGIKTANAYTYTLHILSHNRKKDLCLIQKERYFTIESILTHL